MHQIQRIFILTEQKQQVRAARDNLSALDPRQARDVHKERTKECELCHAATHSLFAALRDEWQKLRRRKPQNVMIHILWMTIP